MQVHYGVHKDGSRIEPQVDLYLLALLTLVDGTDS